MPRLKLIGKAIGTIEIWREEHANGNCYLVFRARMEDDKMGLDGPTRKRVVLRKPLSRK